MSFRIYSPANLVFSVVLCCGLPVRAAADPDAAHASATEYLISVGGILDETDETAHLQGITIGKREMDAIVSLMFWNDFDCAGATFAPGQIQRMTSRSNPVLMCESLSINLTAAAVPLQDVIEFASAVSEPSANPFEYGVFLDCGDYTNSPFSEADIKRLRDDFSSVIRIRYLSEDEAEARNFLRSVGATLDDTFWARGLDVSLEQAMVTEDTVDALLRLSDVNKLCLDGCHFQPGQVQRLRSLDCQDGLQLSLRRSKLLADDLQELVDHRCAKALQLIFGFYWESPVSDEIVEVLETSLNVECDHVSQSELDEILLRQMEVLAHPLMSVVDDYELFLDMINRADLPFITDTDGSIPDYSSLIADKHASPASLIWRASYRLKQSLVDGALKDLSLVIGRPHEATSELERQLAHYFSGRAHAAKSQYRPAVHHFAESRRLGLCHDRLTIDEAAALRETGQFSTAVDQLTQLIERMEASSNTNSLLLSDVYHERAAVYHAVDENRLALADCNRCLDLNPNHRDAIDTRATVYEWLDRLDLAIADYTKLTELIPDSAAPFFHRGDCWVRKCRRDNAIIDYTLCLSRDPDHLAARYARANLWRQRGDYSRCIADLQRMLESDPDSQSAHSFLAHVLARCPDETLRDGRRALVHASKACKASNWRNASCLAALAAAHAENQSFENAVRNAETAVSLAAVSPLDRMVYEGYVNAYRNGEHVRYESPLVQSLLGPECDAIENTAAAGGRVGCWFDNSERRFVVGFGVLDIPIGSFSVEPGSEKPLPREIASDWRLLTNLDTIYLPAVRVDADVQRYLADLPDLRQLQIELCDFREVPSFPEDAFRSLDTLKIRETELPDAFLEAVAQMPRLRVLEVEHCDHNQGKFFPRLLSNPRLEKVVIRSKSFSDEHLQRLATLPRLSQVDLPLWFPTHGRLLSRNGFEKLAESLQGRTLRVRIIEQSSPDLPLCREDVDWLRQHYPHLQLDWSRLEMPGSRNN